MSDVDRTSGFFDQHLETLDPQARQEYLDGRVADIVAHAYEHAPAVTAKMKSVGAEPGDITSVADLSRLPITEKGELVEFQRENLPFGGLCGEPVNKLRRIYVSPGPIYEPGERYYEDDRWTQAFFAGGFRPGDIVQLTFSYHMVPFAFMLDDALNMMDCICVPTGVGNTEIQVQTMKALQVQGYLGTPSFLSAIADKAETMGFDLQKDLNLQVAFVAAEMLPESLRAELEERLGMIIRQSYGTADAGCLSYECYHMGGMHYAQNCVVEVVDPDTGLPRAEGEPGEVVCTVFNKTYPLIRFGTGDLSAYTTETCACGRTSPKLTRIMGRVDQVTKIKGMFVHPSNVAQVAAKFPQISAYQIVVTRANNQDVMTFCCELSDPSADQETFRAEVATEVKDILRLKGGVEVKDAGSIAADAKVIDDQRVWD